MKRSITKKNVKPSETKPNLDEMKEIELYEDLRAALSPYWSARSGYMASDISKSGDEQAA